MSDEGAGFELPPIEQPALPTSGTSSPNGRDYWHTSSVLLWLFLPLCLGQDKNWVSSSPMSMLRYCSAPAVASARRFSCCCFTLPLLPLSLCFAASAAVATLTFCPAAAVAPTCRYCFCCFVPLIRAILNCTANFRLLRTVCVWVLIVICKFFSVYLFNLFSNQKLFCYSDYRVFPVIN